MNLKRVVVLGLAALAAAAGPASAGVSPGTAAFIAAAGPFNGFLAAEDRLAAERGTPRLRRFAGADLAGRDAVLEALRRWAAATRAATDRAAHAPTIDGLGPLFGTLDDPIDIVVVPADVAQRRDLATLATLEGEAFDELFLVARAQTLRRLVETYVDFIKNGDDEGLRAIAVRDLPRVRALLAATARR